MSINLGCVPKMSDINPGFTEDIWFEIFKYLPVKTLGRCRCVCKSWHSLVVSPCFMAAHLKHYTQNAANSLLLFRHYTEALTEQYTLFLDDVVEGKEKKALEPCHKFNCPFALRKDNHYFRFVGTVHGLICLSDDIFSSSNSIMVWNPLIQIFIRLSPSEYDSYKLKERRSVLGFGYDARKNDHKVVKITYRCVMRGLESPFPRIEIYSVQEGTWKSISAEVLVNYHIPDKWWKSYFFNGAIYWPAYDTNPHPYTSCLLVFDVQEEKFKKLELPDAFFHVCTFEIRLSEYSNNLSILRSVYRPMEEISTCEIWVMEESNGGCSWRQIVNLELDVGITSAMNPYFRKNGEILGFSNRKWGLQSYDSKTKQARNLGLETWLCIYFASYTESLILLPKQNGIVFGHEAEA